MKQIKRLIFFVALPLAVAAALMNGCNVGQYDEPAHTVVNSTSDGIELRDYAPAIAAEVSVKGERKEAVSQGFRLIADFIFGNNTTKSSIAMTTPVTQQSSEKIAMTTPVIQQGAGDAWVVQFIMPKEYTLETLPKPNNAAVKIKSIPTRTMAVIRFSGGTRDDHKIAEKTAELKAYLVVNKLTPKGQPVLAFYDPPWTLPFLRRNEVMLEVARPHKKR